jgi:hypothetical protein
VKPWVWGLGAAGLLLLVAGGAQARVMPSGFRRYSYGGSPYKRGVDRDPSRLIPSFADKIEVLFQRLRARGFDPYLWEGWRSPARAAQLEEKGTGIRLSMHSLGAAVDIVNGAQIKAGGSPWVAPAQFWNAVGEEARKLGLTWGGVFTRTDRPHVQAITVREQAAFRRMNDAQRAAYV